MFKQIRILALNNIHVSKDVIKSFEDLLDNISYAVDLFSNIVPSEKEQQEIIKFIEMAMRNHNEVCYSIIL